ncbi:MAG: efflux RND transporter periplasmic adaptor subunit [Firmicutes bacterium]|nr:efflux RND transporter periplasmic adaptor subunit [Bacillota bacterium]
MNQSRILGFVKRRLHILFAVILISIAIVAITLGITRSATRKTAADQIRVQTIPARIGDISETVSALGTLEPATRVELKAELAGRIRGILVAEGDIVKKNQVIAELDTRDLEVKLKQAEANYLSARADLNKLLAGPSEADLAQASSAYEQARLALQSAKDQVARDKALYDKGALSKQQWEDSSTKLKTCEQQLLATKKKLDDLQAGPRKEDVDAARARVSQGEADLAAARRDLESASIRAPIGGTVIDIPVQEGDMVNAGATLAVVADLAHMKAVIPVNEIDVPKLRHGQEALIRVDALPNERFSGKVTEIGYEGMVRDNIVTYEVTADVPNPDGRLRPGMTVDVNIVLRSKRNTLIIPVDALIDRGGRTIVMISGEKGPISRQVTTGLRTDTMVEIVDGLAPGDNVVLPLEGRPSSGNYGSSGRGQDAVQSNRRTGAPMIRMMPGL